MVWFQCEDCGESLKKPKLTTHFHICYATELSCIDCGEEFGQQSVQSHTQCITDALRFRGLNEKYGPKGEKKVANAKPAKPVKGNQKPDFDVYVGLSDVHLGSVVFATARPLAIRPCLVMRKARSTEQKHELFTPQTNPNVERNPLKLIMSLKTRQLEKNCWSMIYYGRQKRQEKNSPKENGKATSDKKRKLDADKDDADCKSSVLDTSENLGDGNVVENQAEEKKTTK
ncbi:UBP1-associated proteins 1C-like protein [Drosera capensis]